MNAIIIHQYQNQKGINGAIIDAFEYYIQILEYNPEIELIFVSYDHIEIDYLFEIFEEKYYLEDLDWKKNIKIIPIPKLIYRKFNNILIVDYSTAEKVSGLFVRTNNIFYLSEIADGISNFFFKEKNVEYYGEMPFIYKTKQYTLKILFNRMRMFNNFEHHIFLNNPRRGSNRKFIEHPPEYYKQDIDIKEHLDRPFFIKKQQHTKNLFDYFNKYIYYNTNEYFDPRPRLFHECYFQGKEIVYLNKQQIKDGSWYRYHEMLENGIKNRILSKDDEIVREFI